MRKIVIVGSGVAGINAATELVDNGYPGENIILIDKGKDPFNRNYNFKKVKIDDTYPKYIRNKDILKIIEIHIGVLVFSSFNAKPIIIAITIIHITAIEP